MIASFASWFSTYTHVLSGGGYAFWSGFGSDIGEVTIVVGMVAFYRKGNCHQHRCWRLSHHAYVVDGVTYNLCRKHHPDAVRHLKAHHLLGEERWHHTRSKK